MKKKRFFRTIVILCCAVGLITEVCYQEKTTDKEKIATKTTTDATVTTELYAGVMAEFRNNEVAYVQENQELLVMAALENELTEDKVYSFLQGPKSWGNGVTWSGEWCLKYVKGNYFGGFGCGLCCMANIYSTLTDYTCSPLDMYEYATEVSGYYPSKKSGAIGWGDMKVTLQKCGFVCDVYQKPGTYEEFRQQIAEAQSAIVLVSSYNDNTYWEDTSGHYVNIWLYNEETEEVFLTEPGGPEKNRTWVPLRYVYDALKTSSQYQYLMVNDYKEEDNLWRHDGIDEQWVTP
ncbi:MAG: chaperonin [Roseburia sp.]